MTEKSAVTPSAMSVQTTTGLLDGDVAADADTLPHHVDDGELRIPTSRLGGAEPTLPSS